MDLIIIMPITAAASVVFFIILKIYLKIREYCPVAVECWFCCQKTKVPFEEANSWDCLNCNQYNGFLEDGDYNRPIPAQYDEFLNVPLYASKTTAQTKYMRNTPTLCANCNCNQQMKIAQLAMFVPFDQKNFDFEIEKYSQQLEKIYGICSSCDATVAEVLKKQEKMYGAKLPSVEEKKFNSKPKRQPIAAVKRLSMFTHYASILLGLVLFYRSTRTLTQVDVIERFIDLLYNSLESLPISTFTEEKYRIISLAAVNYFYRFYSIIPQDISDILISLSKSLDSFMIGAFIFIYMLEFFRMRNTSNLLNVGTWIILMSLKISDTAPEYLISTTQALAALVFVYMSIGSLRREKKIKSRKENMKKQLGNRIKITISNNDVTKKPIARKDDTFVKSKPCKPKPVATVTSNPSHTLQEDITRLSNPSHTLPEDITRSSVKLKSDYGLSDLSLGPRATRSNKNHLTTEPRPYCGRLNDQIWSRSTVLSPSRLNVEAMDSPFDTTLHSPPLTTRSSNESSGLGSIASNQQDSMCNEQPYNKFTPINLSISNIANERFNSTPTHPGTYYDFRPVSEVSFPTVPYYHFAAAQLQRSFPFSPLTPQSNVFLNNANTSPTNSTYSSLLTYPPVTYQPFPPFHTYTNTTNSSKVDSSKYSVFHNIIFPVSVFILIVCNITLLGFVYYKELSPARNAA